MKSIYISGQRKKKSYFLPLFSVLIIFAAMLGVLHVVAPYVLRDYINKTGEDDRGHTYRVGDLDINLVKGEMDLKDVRVFHKSSTTGLAYVHLLKVNFNWLDLARDEKNYKLHADVVDVLLSKHLVQEIGRIKQDAKADRVRGIFLKSVTANVKRFNLREMDNDNIRTVLTLNDLEANLKNMATEKIYDNSEFTLKSKILEGGAFSLTGRAEKVDGSLSWKLTGNLSGIPSRVLEKMAGTEAPLDLAETKVDAAIVARSADGIIKGEMDSRIKDFRFTEEKTQDLIRRGLNRVTKLLLQDKLEEDGSLKVSIPFTLKESFSVDVPEALKKIE